MIISLEPKMFRINSLQLLFFPFSLVYSNCIQQNELQMNENEMQTDALQLSKDFLNALKDGKDASKYVIEIQQLDSSGLAAELNNDDKKTAFWLNIYNGFVQYLLKNNADLYKERNNFFSDELFTIAGEELSLDDIEHGFLRHSKIKVSLGLLEDPFPGGFEKQFRVSEVDWRIHFALNCGAKSCPPIALYEADQIKQQLRTAAIVYLEQNVEYIKEDNKVVVPRVMDWFRADFGGKKGVVEILKDYFIIPRNVNPTVSYKDYNWKLSLNNYN